MCGWKDYGVTRDSAFKSIALHFWFQVTQIVRDMEYLYIDHKVNLMEEILLTKV